MSGLDGATYQLDDTTFMVGADGLVHCHGKHGAHGLTEGHKNRYRRLVSTAADQLRAAASHGTAIRISEES